MVGLGYASLAEGAVFAAGWFGEVAGAAGSGVGVEEDVVVGVVAEADVDVVWGDEVGFVGYGQEGEVVGEEQEEWNR